VNTPRPNTTVICDFDGTITEDDMLDEVARRFGDAAVYASVDESLHRGALSLREVIRREFEPVRAPLPDVVAWVLENVRVRPGFGELVGLARRRGHRLVVLSSGFRELIEPVLARERIEVELHANSVDPRPEGWRIRWRDEAVCETCDEACKRATVRTFARGGPLVYIGDGYSDRCAALASDRVFAIRGLAAYLKSEGIPYEPFRDFFDIARALESQNSFRNDASSSA